MTPHVARRHVARRLGGWAVQRAVVPSCVLLMGCASSGSDRVAGQLKAYEILVPGRDSISAHVAAAFGRRGFRVRAVVRGGSRPTLAYVAFWFSEPGAGGEGPRYYARLGDARTGGIGAAGTAAVGAVRGR